MQIDDLWQKALKKTEIIRTRVQALKTYQETRVPYIFLSESSINDGDTLVRKGEIVVEKPALVLPPNIPQFSGFDFKEQEIQEDSVINFLLVRGIALPSLKYNNQTASLDIYENSLAKAIKHYEQMLQSKENVQAGLIAGPEDCWQFSLLIFICSQIVKNADHDIKHLINEYKRNHKES